MPDMEEMIEYPRPLYEIVAAPDGTWLVLNTSHGVLLRLEDAFTDDVARQAVAELHHTVRESVASRRCKEPAHFTIESGGKRIVRSCIGHIGGLIYHSKQMEHRLSAVEGSVRCDYVEPGRP
jgi:hypothetical protein